MPVRGHSSPSARELAIIEDGRELQLAANEAALVLAHRVRAWLEERYPCLPKSAPTCVHLADDLSLAAFEGYGQWGDAVELDGCPYGTVWWCDPEDRPSSTDRFLAYVSSHGQSRTVQITFA